MAYTLSFAIAGSMILALTAIPVFMTMIYRKHFETNSKLKLNGTTLYIPGWRKNGKLIDYLTNHSIHVIITSFAIVLLVIVFGNRHIGTEFLPELDEGSFNIRCFFPVGITLQDADKYCPVIRNVISSHKQVNVVLTQLGRNDDGNDPYGPNRLEILVGLKNYSTWTQDTSKELLFIKVEE